MAKKNIQESDSDDSHVAVDMDSNSPSLLKDCDTSTIGSGIVKNVMEESSESKLHTPEIFRLSCLHEWNEEALLSCLKNYLKNKREQDTNTSKPELDEQKLPTHFTPWWEDFTKSECHKSETSRSELHQDNDAYESWFDQNAAGGLSWLCGPSSVPSQKSQREDIQVPSIYDNRPAPKGRRALKRERRAEREKTLGKKWFGMKAPDVDEKLKMDMEIIKMRAVLDPKRFYKHHDRKGLPKYFQMGTVVDEGTDFYSSRLTKKQRKQTLVEELMADANIRQYNKKKYSELQQKMRSKKIKNKQKSS